MSFYERKNSFALETLTPINVGNGNVKTNYSDYIYKDNYIYYIHHDKLEKQIAKMENYEIIIDKFVNIINSQAKSNKSDKYNMLNFFDEFGLELADYSHKKIKVFDRITEEIQCTIVTGNRPYIPGSTLKGTIRTALIAHHFEEKGLELANLSDKHQKSYIGQNFFGEYSEDIFKHLAVSDTIPFNEEEIEVLKTYTFNIKTNDKNIPVVKEFIPQGCKTTFILQSKGKEKQHPIDSKFHYLIEGKETEILKMINGFYVKCIEKEINDLEKNSRKELKPIFDIYIKLLNLAKSLDTTKEAIMRIGSGKTIFENTIAIILNQKDREKWLKSMKGKDDFPVTRNIIFKDNKPHNVSGWVKIKTFNF